MLEVKNLVCGYNKKLILKKIDFQINDKEFFGIIGPNGSGKTTLFRALTGVLKPSEGEILFKNKNISEIKFNELARYVAVVSQNLDTELYLTVEEYILLGRIPHYKKFQFFENKNDLEVAERCMQLTNTLKFKKSFIGELSSGERQLVAIARGLAQDTEILLLDEPTAHLDINHQVNILNLLKKLNREIDLTVIIILHDLNLASEYCDRLMLLNEGQLYKIGNPNEVLTYKNIEEIYKTLVIVKENPISNKPYIFLVSEGVKK